MQLIDLERRSSKTPEELENVVKLYKNIMRKIPDNRKTIRSWLALKLSRFQFKFLNKTDDSLKTLFNALKKDKSDPKIFTQIIDTCYQVTPVDIDRITAAIGMYTSYSNRKLVTILKAPLPTQISLLISG